MKIYHKNPRIITKQQYTDLEAWLDELGDLSGIVHDLNSDEIPAGNQRSRVFGIIKDEGKIVITETLDEPTRQGTVARGYIEWHGEKYNYRQVRWTPKQCEKANIIANKAGGEFEWETLANEFEFDDLLEWGFSREELLGNWGDDDNDEPPPLAQMDKADELQEKWQVKTGDVWQCGPHFIICGDCREAATWTQLLALAEIENANGVFTSPPYAEQRKKQYGGVPTAEYVDWWEVVQDNVRRSLAADGSFFVNIKPHCEDGERVLYVFDLVLAMRRRWGWRYKEEFAWCRGGYPGDACQMGRFKNVWESVYWFSTNHRPRFRPKNVRQTASVQIGQKTKKGSLAAFQGTSDGGYLSPPGGMAFPGNVLQIRAALQPDAPKHAAAFPVALPDFFIRAYSDPGDVWIDPFLGSGTTICAAHQNDRCGLGIERLEKYVSVCLERMAGLELTPVRIESN